ncbi:MAG: hypothetical protein ABW069_07920 [Duganella sp.]
MQPAQTPSRPLARPGTAAAGPRRTTAPAASPARDRDSLVALLCAEVQAFTAVLTK